MRVESRNSPLPPGTGTTTVSNSGTVYSRCTGLGTSPGVRSLDAVGAPYSIYLIQFSPSLDGGWNGIGILFTDASGIGEFLHTQFDNPPPPPGRGFYRLAY